MCGPTPLTERQRAVVDAPPDARLLLVAPAGTGKTRALAERHVNLVVGYGLSPGVDVLTIASSRSAVRVVHDLVRDLDGSLDAKGFATVDSFATALLSRFDRDGRRGRAGSDDRISAATRLIRTDDEAAGHLRGLRHVLVDDAQDLVAERARFVEALLEVSGGGFTVCGDPAQAVYGFERAADQKAGLADGLIPRLRCAGSEIVEVTLTENLRAVTDDARRAVWAGPVLEGADPDYADVRWRLCTDLMEAGTVGEVEAAALALSRGGGSTAILCRTNGQALVVSRRLHAAEVPHLLARAAGGPSVAPWVARVLAETDGPYLSRREVVRRMAGMNEAARPEPGIAWALLHEMGPYSDDELDIDRIREAIATGAVPDDLTSRPSAGLTVSTIHRAKASEFDRVVVVEPAVLDDRDDAASETRLLYVAMTRARRSVRHMVAPSTKGMFLTDRRRWACVRGPGRLAFEVRDDDMHRSDPAGAYILDDLDVREIQTHLVEGVHPGDPVRLQKVTREDADDSRVHYAVLHDGHVVGVTAEPFGLELWRFVSGRKETGARKRWPEGMGGLYVEGVDTVAGSAAVGLQHGLGASGVWLRVRVAGLGDLEF